MHPVLFDLPLGPLGTFTVGTYGLFYALGFLLGLRLAVSYARRDGIEPARILDLGIVGLLAGFVGAKLLLYALDARYYLAEPVRMLQNLRSAGVYYGGLGLAVAAGVGYVRRHGLPLGKVADLSAPALSLGQAIGRIGCFLAGCCYGRACDLPWGVTFHDPRAAELTGVPIGVRLHPTQLYHGAADVITLVVAMALMRRRRFDGQVFWTWLLLYSILRAVVEYWRGDLARGVFFSGSLSTSQIISIPIAIVSAVMLWRLGRRTGITPAAAAGRRAR
jgi:phosphatidylglycerol:prolipoprotein diacylglycerol transferase